MRRDVRESVGPTAAAAATAMGAYVFQLWFLMLLSFTFIMWFVFRCRLGGEGRRDRRQRRADV